MCLGREKCEASVSKEPLERNKGQQIDLGCAGHVCQPENKHDLAYIGFCHSLERQYLLFTWFWTVNHWGKKKKELMCGPFVTKKVLGIVECLVTPLPETQLRSPPSCRGPHLFVLSAIPCQNPPQKYVEETPAFEMPILPYIEWGLNPHLWDHGMTLIFQEQKTSGHDEVTPVQKSVTAESRDGSAAFQCSLEKFLCLSLSGLFCCSRGCHKDLCDPLANQGIKQLYIWNNHQAIPTREQISSSMKSETKTRAFPTSNTGPFGWRGITAVNLSLCKW